MALVLGAMMEFLRNKFLLSGSFVPGSLDGERSFYFDIILRI